MISVETTGKRSRIVIRQGTALALVSWCVLLSACTGRVQSVGTPAESAAGGVLQNTGVAGSTSTAAASGMPPVCDEPSPGVAPMRRMTVSEYEFVAEDLFGYRGVAVDNLPAENRVDGYDNNVDNGSVSQLRAERFFEVAEAIATDPGDLRADLPCSSNEVDEDCVGEFVATLGRRIWRRPLEAEEVTTLSGVFFANSADDLDTRLATVLEAILVAPQFLFRPEVGRGGEESAGVMALTDHEVATRLAFLIWVSTPDEMLLDAADAGLLSTRDEVEIQARRMVDDPRGKRGLRHFVMQWIDSDGLRDLTRSQLLYPEFDGDLVRDMREELERFVDEIAWEKSGTLADLLTSNSAQINGRLADLYGVDHPGTDAWLSVELPADQRRGLLTRAGFLTGKAHSISPAPVQRGLWVRTRALCGHIPAPPDDVDISLPEPVEARTNRELLAQHSSDALCAGCHGFMDPIGFGFENYDSIGRFSTEDHNGLLIDASGEFKYTEDSDGPFEGALELVERLAQSDEVAECMTTQVFRYAHGRRADDADACAVHALSGQRESSLKDLLVAVTLTDGFRYRQRDTGE